MLSCFLHWVAFRRVHRIPLTEKRWKSFSMRRTEKHEKIEWGKIYVLVGGIFGIKETRSFRESRMGMRKFPWTFLSCLKKGERFGTSAEEKKLCYHFSFSSLRLHILLPLFKRKYVSLNGFLLHRHNNFYL